MLGDLALWLHIASGAAGLVLGPVAMRAAKRPGVHTRAGEAYHWVVLAVCASAVVLAILEWSELWWLALVGAFSYGFALVGYMAAKRRRGNWLRAHVSGQGGSYIALVTAFAVVNLGDSGAGWIAWAAPTVIGSALVAWTNFQVATGRRPKAWAERRATAEPNRRSARPSGEAIRRSA